jgi:hypothetical protein
VILPQDYVVQKFYQYAGFPKYKKLTRVYEASCPICREGKSWGKKKRCYYLTEDNVICCHNCGWFGSPLNWIKQVTGLSVSEIYKEVQNYDILPVDILKEEIKAVKVIEQQTLPLDSINLFDESQVEFYKNNRVVRDALELIKSRRLSTAINRPDTIWLSLTDKVHKNRIIIPFYDVNKNIIFYQSRAIYSKDTKLRPKYLGKINGERSLYNLHKISPDLDYIFIFEGPIDSFFVKNGTAVAGIQEQSHKSFSLLQETQISSFRMYTKIWVLDSQWTDRASRIKTEKLLDSGERVFIWPEEIGTKFKEINELCITANRDSLDPDLFIKHSYTDIKGKLMLSTISR